MVLVVVVVGRVDELFGDIVVEDRCHVEEIVVIWIDHQALHCFVVVSVFQGEGIRVQECVY